jgi:hypothetical protein
MKLEQVIRNLDWYNQGLQSLDDSMLALGVKRRRFFDLLKLHRNEQLLVLSKPKTNSHRRIDPLVDDVIRRELEADKALIDNPDIPLKYYNYSAIRDSVVDKIGRSISAQTIRNRARDWGYKIPRPKSSNPHTRVVLTSGPGILLQHDASHHLWSPYADKKWCLITTIDDYSRMLIYAELFEEESSWNHILALESVVASFGVGCDYYADNHSIFRYTDRTQSYWQTPKVSAADVKTQWKMAVEACGMGVIYALSPEAKGKVERPYRWLQDRIVRRCAKQQVKTIEEAKLILGDEVNRYNNRQVHSTTREIPSQRLRSAIDSGISSFKPLVIPEPYSSTKDVFCLRESRVVNGYGAISWRSRYITMPKNIPEGAKIDLHIIPISSHPEVRFWYKQELVSSISFAPSNPTVISIASNSNG